MTAEPDIEGGLSAITEWGLIGWAWHLTKPDLPATVVVQSDGVELGRGIANRFEDEITAVHGHIGRPGFCIRLNQLPGGRYPLALTLHDLAGARIGGPFMVRDSAELTPITDAVAAKYEGSVDTFHDGFVFGWVRDMTRPDVSLSVVLLDAGQTIAKACANEFREDLRSAGKGSGHHGYRLSLPVGLIDGRGHTLRVQVAGGAFELPNSPIAFGPLPAFDPMVEINEIRNEVRQLAQRIDALMDPGGRLLNDIVRRLSLRVAALAEIQREGIERELDAIRRVAFAVPEPKLKRKSPSK